MKKQITALALASVMMSSVLPISLPVLAEEPEVMEESGTTRDRQPTEIKCALTLNAMVDGQEATDGKLQYNADATSYAIQYGGTLNLKNIWNNYDLFKSLYILKNGPAKFKTKALTGEYTYQFHVNPEVVSVNEDIITDTDAWQQAFRTGSGEKAATFFDYMQCTSATYDENTGLVSVVFTIEYNDELKVPVTVIEDSPVVDGTKNGKPNTIESYSPEGAFTITNEKFVNGAEAFPGPVSFEGTIDLSPWMALVFPIHFESENHTTGLTLVGKPDTPQQPDTPTPPTPGGGGSGSGSGGGTAVTKTVDLYRLYNPNSGEHFYTQNASERDYLTKKGWSYEGIGWTSPITSKYPVFRLYNPNAGDHHFTLDANERDELTKVGWHYEGISWYSLPAYQGVKVYREYNPNAKEAGAHNYTTNKVENDYLISIGWLDEGIGWWASAAGKPIK